MHGSTNVKLEFILRLPGFNLSERPRQINGW